MIKRKFYKPISQLNKIMGLDLNFGLEQRFEQPGIFAGGGYSPPIDGLPIKKYSQIAPVKIDLVDPTDFRYTDLPGSFSTFYDLQELWERSFLNSFNKRKWKPPLICPPVIDEDYVLADGNHRSAAAALHSPRMHAILVENQQDIEALQKLVEAGVFWWPHCGCTYEELISKRKDLAQDIPFYDYLERLKCLRIEEGFVGWNGILFSDEINRGDLLKYCVGSVIHQNLPYFLGRTNVIPRINNEDWIDCFPENFKVNLHKARPCGITNQN